MAFDKKRQRTFKWLQSLADHKARYCPSGGFYDIMVYCGRFYATNQIILAEIEWPEFEHVSDYEWSNVTKFEDKNGLLLEYPELESREHQFVNNRYLSDMFINMIGTFIHKFDVRVMKDALKPFEINNIMPNMATDNIKIELSGHNDDVSIRVLMMGVRL